VQSPFVGGIDLNGDGSAFNDRPAISVETADTGIQMLVDMIDNFNGGAGPTRPALLLVLVTFYSRGEDCGVYEGGYHALPQQTYRRLVKDGFIRGFFLSP
jgi:hypothetical protein